MQDNMSMDDSFPLRGLPHIVLAEDDDELRGVLVAVLAKNGYCVTDVSTGSALLATLRRAHRAQSGPSLIITDEFLPNLRGLDVLAQTQGWGWHAPLLLFTAFGDDDVLTRASKAGVTVLHKPFDLGDFLTLVRYLAPVTSS